MNQQNVKPKKRSGTALNFQIPQHETKRPKEHQNPIGKVLIYVALCIWAFTTIFPFVWVLNNSFKDSSLVISDSFSPAFIERMRYDKYGDVAREQVLLDEQGRLVYDAYLMDENGQVLMDEDTDPPLPAYDKVNGRLMYDQNSPEVVLSPTWRNYVTAFTNPNVNILNGYKNSLIISGTVMLAVMLLATMIAFALSRYKFPGQGIVRNMIVAALMFPAFSTIVPVYRMVVNIGLFDRLPSVILVQTAGNLAFATTVMLGFVAALPKELEEAAFMEGCGPFQVFFRIVLPMCKPALATVAIFTFLWSYNDLFVQMILLRSKAQMPVCAILREISSIFGTDFGLMAAAVVVVVVPVLIIYIALQQNIIKGLTAGAVKG
ncbi:carbohydrate ABC transporter permease [Eubacteriales bacterium OttesenSCG-928-N13]|nr:carbohydrate ABC transporter permease [Eubacteriales bacterium OttesenSCG-928-N13]